MSLIYPEDGQSIGEAIAEVEALGGSAGNTFTVTRDHEYRTVIDLDDELYEKWQKKHGSTSDKSGSDSAGAEDASAEKADDKADSRSGKSGKKAR